MMLVVSVTEAAPLPRSEPGAEPSLRDVLWRIALLALGIRVALEVFGLVSLAAHGQPVWSNALELWGRWDAPHYLRIAEVGYRAEPVPGQNPDDPLFIVFFPFFPLAVRTASVIFRDLVLAGLMVSYVATVFGMWFLYRLVRIDADHDEAWRAVLLLFAFPTAYFLAAPYTEALFLLAVVGCVYAARTARWARAGLAGALATGTRVAGVALAPALVAEAIAAPGPRGAKLHRLGWASLGAGGLLVYLAINLLVHGDPLGFLHVQRSHWYQQAVAPWTPIYQAVRGLLEHASPAHTFILRARLAGFAFALPLLVLAVRRLRTPDWLYGWSGLVLVLSTSWLISLPRYLLGLYPIFMVLASLTRSPRVLWPTLAAGIVGQSWFFWRFAVGEWTF